MGKIGGGVGVSLGVFFSFFATEKKNKGGCFFSRFLITIEQFGALNAMVGPPAGWLGFGNNLKSTKNRPYWVNAITFSKIKFF